MAAYASLAPAQAAFGGVSSRGYAEEAAVFGSIGWPEILVLLLVALFVFGPDKLPQVARDAARMLRELRNMAQGARNQLKDELGPEFADFDLDTLNPKAFVRKHLFEDQDPLEELRRDPFRDNPLDDNGNGHRRSTEPQRLKDGERPPFDPDTT